MQLLKADINVALGDTILSVNMYIYKTEQNRIYIDRSVIESGMCALSTGSERHWMTLYGQSAMTHSVSK